MTKEQKATVKAATKEVKKQIDAQTNKFAPTTITGKVAEFANKDVALAGLRQSLIAVGWIMFYYGIVPDANMDGQVTSTDWDSIVGAILLLVGVGTSFWNTIKNYRRKKLLAAAQVIAPKVIDTAANVAAETVQSSAHNSKAGGTGDR